MPSKRLIKDPERYKTVMCMTWTNTGQCPYGRKCQFAHGKEELRVRPPGTAASPPSQPVRLPMLPPPPMSLPMATIPNGSTLPPPSMPLQVLPGWTNPAAGAHSNNGSQPPPPLPPGPPPPGNGMMPAPAVMATNGAPLPPAVPPPPLPPGPPPATLLGAPAKLPMMTSAVQAPSALGAHAPPAAKAQVYERMASFVPLPLPSAQAATMPSMVGVRRPTPHHSTPVGPPSMAPPMPQAAPPSVAPPMAYVSAPSMAPPQPSPPSQPPQPPPAQAVPARAMAPSAAPAPAPTDNPWSRSSGRSAKRSAVSAREGGDELACLAMQMHISQGPAGGAVGMAASAPSEAPPQPFPGLEPGGGRNVWSPIRLNSCTGKVEMGSGSSASLLGSDSPIEPGLSKREVSFSTQMVRRAVSFIFDDAAANSPVKQRSAQTALAA